MRNWNSETPYKLCMPCRKHNRRSLELDKLSNLYVVEFFFGGELLSRQEAEIGHQQVRTVMGQFQRVYCERF